MQTPEQIIINELKRIVEMLAQENSMLRSEIDKLKQRSEKLEAKKNSRNSSIPPSKDENRPKRTNSLRKKSDKKVGGQPGHKGKTLEMTKYPDIVVDHHACFCPACGNDVSELPVEVSSKRQVIEIPQIKQVVTEHRIYCCTCSCGKIVESDFPAGIDWPVSYGQNIESLVSYLSVRQHLPFKRLQEMMHDLFGVSISEGGLHSLLNRLAKKGEQAYEIIRQVVMNSPVIGTD